MPGNGLTSPSPALITRNFNGMAFTFRADGYFNMTAAAKHFGKQLQHFWNSPETMEYRAALQELNSSESDEYPSDHVAVQGRNGGTWAHPKLAIFFARWLDVRFAVWCDAVIEDILKGNAGPAMKTVARVWLEIRNGSKDLGAFRIGIAD